MVCHAFSVVGCFFGAVLFVGFMCWFPLLFFVFVFLFLFLSPVSPRLSLLAVRVPERGIQDVACRGVLFGTVARGWIFLAIFLFDRWAYFLLMHDEERVYRFFLRTRL